MHPELPMDLGFCWVSNRPRALTQTGLRGGRETLAWPPRPPLEGAPLSVAPGRAGRCGWGRRPSECSSLALALGSGPDKALRGRLSLNPEDTCGGARVGRSQGQHRGPGSRSAGSPGASARPPPPRPVHSETQATSQRDEESQDEDEGSVTPNSGLLSVGRASCPQSAREPGTEPGLLGDVPAPPAASPDPEHSRPLPGLRLPGRGPPQGRSRTQPRAGALAQSIVSL